MTEDVATAERDSLPEELAGRLAGYRWRPVTVGCSGALVFRLEGAGRPALYLKLARGADPPLEGEAARLGWMTSRGLPVPRVQAFLAQGGAEYLLTAELAGLDASAPRPAREAPAVVEALAAGLRLLHAVDVADCPFDATLERRLADARRRVALGLVDEADFDAEHRGRSAASLLDELLSTRPLDEDPVLTHGDCCLPNVVLRGRALAGFVDCGGAGVADRYQDLALAARSLEHNLGARWVPLLFERYGLPRPDEGRLAFYRLLDEFF